MFVSMRITQAFTAVVMTATLFSLSSFADDPFEGIGKGRLLKKFRDDLFGKPEQPSRPQPPTQKSTAAPTPASPRSAAQVAQKPSNMAQPNLPGRSNPAGQRSNSNANRQSTADAHSRQQLPASQSRSNSPIPASKLNTQNTQAASAEPLNATRTSALATQGLGMLIETKDEKSFYVTQLDRKGNAAKAGVQRGDMVLKVGGTPLVSIEELDEVCKILSPGDQLEFEISQHGRKNTVLVQFGEAKELPAGIVDTNAPHGNRNAAEYGQSSNFEPLIDLQLNGADQNNYQPTGRYDFVPPQSEATYQSVLEQPGMINRPTRPAAYSRSPLSSQLNRQRDDDQARRSDSDLRATYGDSILDHSR